jgi:signal peptidase I
VIRQRAHLKRDIIEVLVLVGFVFLITVFAVQGRSVNDTTMHPNLEPHQAVLINKVSYFFGEPQRGDVVILTNPADLHATLVRRIVALPGDTIVITAAQVIINGVPLNEPYTYVPFGMTPNATLDQRTLGPSEYYVLCDSRRDDACLDSRTFGPVPRANISGKAVMVYWPLNSIHMLPNYSDLFSNAAKHR